MLFSCFNMTTELILAAKGITKMNNMRLFALATFVVVGSSYCTNAFVASLPRYVRPVVIKTYQTSSSISSGHPRCRLISTLLFASPSTAEASSEPPSTPTAAITNEYPPILDELRTVAMKLHTREQAPREGQAEPATPPSKEPYIPTHVNYLQFLVDSHAIYTTIEDIVNNNDNLLPFRHTGIERTVPLTKDITWMCTKYNLPRPDVGQAGANYVEQLRTMVMSTEKVDNNIPKFMCHYYNYYFAHLAGGRMIGKSMSKLLLDGETLEFYKWDEDVNELKAKVKNLIEEIAKQWTRKERDECINATMDAFKGGGAINGYLSGGNSH